MKYIQCINVVDVFASLGAPLPGMDPSALSTGDLVRVELEPEVFRAVQEGHGGWNEVMLNVSSCSTYNAEVEISSMVTMSYIALFSGHLPKMSECVSHS